MPPVSGQSGAIRQSRRLFRNWMEAEGRNAMQCRSKSWGVGNLVRDAGRRARLLYSSMTPAGGTGRIHAGGLRVLTSGTPASATPFSGTQASSEICIKLVQVGGGMRRLGRSGREGCLTALRVEWGGDERQGHPQAAGTLRAAVKSLPANPAPSSTAELTPSCDALRPPSDRENRILWDAEKS